jgi:hypothetical protein
LEPVPGVGQEILGNPGQEVEAGDDGLGPILFISFGRNLRTKPQFDPI